MDLPTLLRARTLAVAGAVALAATAVVAGPASAKALSGPGHDTASVQNGILTITGTDTADNIVIGSDTQNMLVQFNNGSSDKAFGLNTFNAINVALGKADDRFVVQPSLFAQTLTVDGGDGADQIQTSFEPDVISGGSGSDSILSGGGIDRIDAGSGDDVVNGGQGNDTASLGSGNDTFVWNPGDGSDTVNGDHGTDTMLFNGSNANEVMSLSPNGQRSVFRRNVASIVMDMGSIETLNLNTFGGADSVAVDDMTGTGLRQANIDLGGADNQVDAVTVNGTANPDRVDVGTTGGAIEVNGLAAQTRVTHAEPTDHLQVTTLDGRDRVTVDGAALSLITIGADLGAGQA